MLGVPLDAGPRAAARCGLGISAAHDADPRLFDRFFGKPVDWAELVGWLDTIDRGRLGARAGRR